MARLRPGRGDKGDRARLVAKSISAFLRSINALLPDFPDYTGLTNPAPLEVPDVQALLRDNEAMIVFIETSSPTWVWAITKTEKRLSLVNLAGPRAWPSRPAALRCGLDRLSGSTRQPGRTLRRSTSLESESSKSVIRDAAHSIADIATARHCRSISIVHTACTRRSSAVLPMLLPERT